MAELVVARLATAKNDDTLWENAVCLLMKHKNPFNTYLWVCGEMEFDQDQKFLGERKLEYVQERESVIRLVQERIKATEKASPIHTLFHR